MKLNQVKTVTKFELDDNITPLIRANLARFALPKQKFVIGKPVTTQERIQQNSKHSHKRDRLEEKK